MQYSIWIVSHPRYPHTQCFREVALALQSAFKYLGIDAPIVANPQYAVGRTLVLGAHLVPAFEIGELPKSSVMFNLEQIAPGSPWLKEGYVELLRRYPVWDFSQRNIEALAGLGITGVQHCPIGYAPELTRIEPAAEQDIDVLMYGSVNDRRQRVLQELQQCGFKAINLFNSYGKERDAQIARAKIVLNLHHYDARIFEIVRVSYLLANHRFVVSEIGSDEQAEAPYREGVVFAPYEKLVETCVRYLKEDGGQRDAITQRGFEIMRSRRQVDFLAPLCQRVPRSNGSVPFAPAMSRDLYLQLMVRCLTNTIYGDLPQDAWSGPQYRPELRQQGKDWPSIAHTMIGVKRLENLRNLLEYVIARDVPGDFIETGVWRGGACILARAVFKAFGVTNRTVWCADSFEGLPEPDPAQYPRDAGDKHHTYTPLAVSLEQVQANFERYGLLDGQVKFLKGWFKDTLLTAPIKNLAVLRLDGDMYESTIQALEALYPKLSPGGFVIVDDYGPCPACRQAVHDYRKSGGIREPIHNIDGMGVYWQRAP